MLEEASIQVHYEQGTHAPLRHKRYLSNPLRKVLNHVDWNASFVSNIPFNELESKVNTDHDFCINTCSKSDAQEMRQTQDIAHQPHITSTY